MIAPGQCQPVFDSLPNVDTDLFDWNYAMRRQMQEICDGIFLGPYACAAKNKREYLKENGITHLVCIRHVMEANVIKPNFPEDFTYQVLEIADSIDQNIIQFLPRTKSFIDEALKSQGKVLIHGNAGISRSAAIVIGYVMEKFGVSYKQAFQFVQSKRFCVNPNNNFMHQLIEYEPIFRARLGISVSSPHQMEVVDVSTKRKHDEIDMEDQQ